MKNLYFFGLLAALTLFAACKKEDEADIKKKEVLDSYAKMVLASYEDTFSAAAAMQQKINAFVAAPSAAGFQACKDAWLAARLPYGQTEAYRFYGGPIDSDDGPEGLINAWPMDENFIDYVKDDAKTGLINDPVKYPAITKKLLTDLNESISEESIFTGWHAIEFLLWGQDFSTTTVGTRPYTDYLTGAGSTAANQARRGQYLKVVTEQLMDNLGEVRDAWKPGAAYVKELTKDTETKIALGYLFTSLGKMSKGELAGERMFVAIDTKDQENEHSCFADNTINDIKMNLLGLKNVYFGSYKRLDGSTVTGRNLAELAEGADRAKADAAKAAFADAEAKVNAIPGPFDATIVNNPNAVVPAITALRALSDKLTDVGFTLGAEF